jgi:preprotein translocase subunit SecG
MIAVVFVVHILIALALIAVILLQKSEGGALGIGGGGMSGFMSGRSTANLLTRTTAFLVAAFFLTSLGLAIFAGHGRAPTSLIDQDAIPAAPPPPSGSPAAPARSSAPLAPVSTSPSAPAAPSTPAPATPAAPTAPLAK